MNEWNSIWKYSSSFWGGRQWRGHASQKKKKTNKFVHWPTMQKNMGLYLALLLSCYSSSQNRFQLLRGWFGPNGACLSKWGAMGNTGPLSLAPWLPLSSAVLLLDPCQDNKAPRLLSTRARTVWPAHSLHSCRLSEHCQWAQGGWQTSLCGCGAVDKQQPGFQQRALEWTAVVGDRPCDHMV